MRIGVISDTHGLIRPDALKALGGSELVVHAGDIGRPEVLDALRAIAPVVAVRGNNDSGPWADALAELEMVKAGTVRICVVHDLKLLDRRAARGARVVISGHSHKPVLEERDGVLYLNPGSAGPRRFKLPVSVATLDVDGKTVRAELVRIDMPA